MAKQNTAQIVETLIRPTVEGLGYSLWDVRFEKEGADSFLRVFITGANPIGINDCEAVSRAIDPIIDGADPIDIAYYLEVSSAGLGRKLFTKAHFDACAGETVLALTIRPLADGLREIRGALVGLDGSAVTILTDAGEVSVEQKDLSYIKLCDDENLFNKATE